MNQVANLLAGSLDGVRRSARCGRTCGTSSCHIESVQHHLFPGVSKPSPIGDSDSLVTRLTLSEYRLHFQPRSTAVASHCPCPQARIGGSGRKSMQPSMFNVRVPLDGSADERVPDEHLHRCAADRVAGRRRPARPRRPGACAVLAGGARRRSRRSRRTASSSRAAKRTAQALEEFFHDVREDTDQLRVTVLTTLQCNFACDYCIQGDHGDYNKNAAKMSLETAARVAEWAEAAARRASAPRASC